jgi:hypothetical protein
MQVGLRGLWVTLGHISDDQRKAEEHLILHTLSKLCPALDTGASSGVTKENCRCPNLPHYFLCDKLATGREAGISQQAPGNWQSSSAESSFQT